ncbi:MAG TPA: S1C family serine protease [bacterium]
MTINRFSIPFLHEFGVLLLGCTITCPLLSGADEKPEVIEKTRQSLVSIRSHTHKGGRVFSRVGSGFIVDRGIVATRRNVIEKADSIVVTVADGRSTTASLLYEDVPTGLAFLSMRFEDLSPLASGRSGDLTVEAPVTVLGNSLGIFPSVTLGSFTGRRPDGLLEIRCLLPAGNCGGPVVNPDGVLVGMVIGRVHREQSPESPETITGLAVPVEQIVAVMKSAARDVKRGGGWVGLSVVDVVNSVSGKSVQVIRLVPGGPADQAGICNGDTIVRIDGSPIQCARAMALKVQRSEPNSSISFSIQKGRTIVPKTVRIGRIP